MSHAHSEASGMVGGSRPYDVFFGPFTHTTDAEVLARAGVTSGDRVLDVGTGPGYLALAASKLVGPGGSAIGIDSTAQMIDRARELAGRGGSRAQYLVASADSLPFGDAAFDVVVSRLVFHHLPGAVKDKALSEMARVLRPGGRLVVVDRTSSLAQGAHQVFTHVLGNDPEAEADLAALVRDAGFAQVTCGELMHGALAVVAAVMPARSSHE